jgi:Tol biopolymer transport system component/DNA-binding winged helix-turn-helix (wHTH) protein
MALRPPGVIAMRIPLYAENLAHFGNFELDLSTHELYRDGSRLKIRGHPVDVLAVLLEHPGELVTRETLRKRLWPNDTFVDFEQILNNSVGKLRDALGDDAESPHYIETLPRLGYRFIAPVHGNGANHSVPAPFVVPSNSTALTADPVPQSSALKRRILWLAIGMTCALGALAYWYLPSPFPPLQVANYEQLTLDGTQKNVAGTDGTRVYLWIRGLRTIAQIPISGGDFTKIPTDLPQGSGPAVGLTDVSPDGSNLSVRGQEGNTIWIVGAAGRPVRYLTKAFAAAWSPDGRSIVCANTHGDIFAIDTDTDKPRMLHREDGPPGQIVVTGHIRWSPDGKTIRFTRRGRGMTIWEISADGTNLHKWLPNWNGSAMRCCGRWTPDGRFYVFLAGPGLAKGPQVWPLAQIWAYDERWATLHPIVRDPFPLALGPLFWGNPVPSRDGKKIFARGVSFRGELERYDRQSNRLEPFLNGISAEMLDFSRDGKYVAYVSFPEGILWRADRDGSGAVQLTKPPLYARSPRWSPDGTRIMFTSNSQDGVDHLYLISSDGGAPEQLLPDETGPLSLGDWSPDGKKVVSATHPGFSLVPWDLQRVETRVIEVATGKFTTLPKSPVGFWAPLWSPDGRYIAGHPSNEIGLLVFDLKTQTYRSLPPKALINYHNWSHDGRFLYFMKTVGNKDSIYRVPVQSGKEEFILELPEGYRGTGWYSSWMSLDPDDTPILFRDVGTDEIYALTLEQK